jgi:hypothetical protein
MRDDEGTLATSAAREHTPLCRSPHPPFTTRLPPLPGASATLPRDPLATQCSERKTTRTLSPQAQPASMPLPLPSRRLSPPSSLRHLFSRHHPHHRLLIVALIGNGYAYCHLHRFFRAYYRSPNSDNTLTMPDDAQHCCWTLLRPLTPLTSTFLAIFQHALASHRSHRPWLWHSPGDATDASTMQQGDG